MANETDISSLATAAWRLEKWLNGIDVDRKMAAKSSLRTIKKYIEACGASISDPTGAKFDPGLAIDVVGNEDESAAEEDLIIIETLAPYVYQNGELVQYARVILGTKLKEESPAEA